MHLPLPPGEVAAAFSAAPGEGLISHRMNTLSNPVVAWSLMTKDQLTERLQQLWADASSG